MIKVINQTFVDNKAKKINVSCVNGKLQDLRPGSLISPISRLYKSE